VIDDAEENERDQGAFDVDGKLARELAAHLHDGNPDEEGVIWPNLAEVSLLGGLGCGGWLLKLILEELEQPNSPYDHVVLQASENSVGFYEHHGFVRVGAIARYEEPTAGADGAVAPRKTGRHTSATQTLAAKDNETVATFARRSGASVNNVLFLNKKSLPGLSASAKLRGGTELRIPQRTEAAAESTLPAFYLVCDS
jgi:hypothetical protein